MERVSNMFIRCNRSGTPLSYSNLLLNAENWKVASAQARSIGRRKIFNRISWLGVAKDPSSLDSLKYDPGTTRYRMFERLVTSRDLLRLWLDEFRSQIEQEMVSASESAAG